MQTTSFHVSSVPGSIMDQLRSAIIPTGPYIHQLSSYINENASRLRTLDADTETWKQLQVIQDCAIGLFAPIRRLPVEILGEIFSYLCVGTVIRLKTDDKSQVLCLSQVCCRWRQIIQDTPRLWTSAAWNIDLRFRDRLSVSMISHFILMSQTAPLNLELYGGWVEGFDSEPSQVLRMLLGQSHRWRSASVTLDEFVWECVMQELGPRPRPVDGYFPILETLNIDDQMFVAEPEPPLGPVDVFEIAPRLSSLTLNDFRDSFVLPYPQIKTLQLNDEVLTDDTLRNMSQCRDLKKLVFPIDSYLKDGRPLLPLPNFTSLTSLILDSAFADLYSRAFRTLTLPSLKGLSIFCLEGVDAHPWPKEEFQSMILRSRCSLEVLDITGPFIVTESSLNETFNVIPNLRTLRIHWTNDARQAEGAVTLGKANYTALLDSLTIKSTEQSDHQALNLLPRLSFLVVIDIPVERDMADKFLKMVDTRKRLGVELLHSVPEPTPLRESSMV